MSGTKFGSTDMLGVTDWFNPLKESKTPSVGSSVIDGGTDWMKTLFGNKEQAGAIQVGTQAVSGAIGAWLGYENLQLAEESLALQKEQFAQNKAAANMEAALKLDARKRGLAAHGISSDIVNKYAAQYK